MEEPLVLLESKRLVALDPSTGAVRWSVSLPGVNPVFARLYVNAEVAVVAAYDSLACCDLRSGALLWAVKTRPGARNGVVVRGARVYLYKDGAIECYDGRGALVFRHEGESKYGGSFGFAQDICWVPNDT
jgi:outer membrane protein assembly factor BamB